MAKNKVIWIKNAELQMFDIMDYYFERNKSTIYSLKLYSEIKLKLQNLDFSVVLPQKTSIENLYYFTHNHISVMFFIEQKTLIVHIIWDERREPSKWKQLLPNS